MAFIERYVTCDSWCGRLAIATVGLAAEVLSWHFATDCALKIAFSAVIYLSMACLCQVLFPRTVKRGHWPDVWVALRSLAMGTPMLQVFILGDQQYGWSQAYSHIHDKGHGWGYWAVSLPVYILVWDFCLYVMHVALHASEGLYDATHAVHHACRPPTAWSGVAVGLLEAVLQGLVPFLAPLFILPFHMPTAYFLNIAFEGWSTLIHSSCESQAWEGCWLLISPLDHNMHHQKGRINGNYGAITTLWDRLFGTLLRDGPQDIRPYWIQQERAARAEAQPQTLVELAGGPSGAEPVARPDTTHPSDAYPVKDIDPDHSVPLRTTTGPGAHFDDAPASDPGEEAGGDAVLEGCRYQKGRDICTGPRDSSLDGQQKGLAGAAPAFACRLVRLKTPWPAA